MRVVVQRVKHASVTINGTVNGKINNGFLVLLGIQSTDGEQDVDYLVKKVTNLRIFSDENDKMNLSLKDVNGELLILQITGNATNFDISVVGTSDIKNEEYITLQTINANNFDVTNSIVANGIYQTDVSAIRKIKVVANSVDGGSINVLANIKEG